MTVEAEAQPPDRRPARRPLVAAVACLLLSGCLSPAASSSSRERDTEDRAAEIDPLRPGADPADARAEAGNPRLDVWTTSDAAADAPPDAGRPADAEDAADDLADTDDRGGPEDLSELDSGDADPDAPPCESDDCPCAENECGGCGRLVGTPGAPCGTCGSGVFACNRPDELVCFVDVGERAHNACGGCEELEATPGDPCGACGIEVCTDDGGLICDDPVPCGSCGDGELGATETCDDGNDERCDGCEMCRVQQVLSFADGGSAVTIVHPDYDVTSFTIELWIWIPTRLEAGDNTVIFAQDAGLDVPGWLTFQLGENTASEVHYAYAGSWGPIPGTFFIDEDGPGRWVHVAITEGGAIGRVWINGALAAQTVPHEEVEPIGGQPFYIGHVPHIPRFRRFAGLIDELRISSTPRYFASFSPQRRLIVDGATVAMWRFDALDGDVVRDRSGNGYDLRLEDGARLVADDGYGLFCD